MREYRCNELDNEYRFFVLIDRNVKLKFYDVMMTDFKELTNLLERISATSSRKEKIKYIAEFLIELDDDEISAAALFIAGRTFPENDSRTLNVSWKGVLSSLGKAMEIKSEDIFRHYDGDIGEAIESVLSSSSIARQTTLFAEKLSISLVSRTLERVASIEGKGSKNEREKILSTLFQIATPTEIRYLVALILGDMRTGVSDALLIESISEAYNITGKKVRRAWNFRGDVGYVAEVAHKMGDEGISRIQVEIFSPIRPMLATAAESIEEILENKYDEYGIEIKYDGARVQIHISDSEVRLYSRKLQEVTAGLPDIVQLVRDQVTVSNAILDGEVIAVNRDGVPMPFQVVMKRFGRKQHVQEKSEEILLRLFLFDIIFLNDETLDDKKYSERRILLESVASTSLIAPSYQVETVEQARQIYEDSRKDGHEGIMIKQLDSKYSPGRRGRFWFKVKHSLPTMDMIVLAAEWGHGKRRRWLSDYHLGVRDDETEEFVMIGKTFKGLTDAELEEMTYELQKISYSTSRGIVFVRPEIVVEILASEIQESPTYESGIALRFARIVRIRRDLGPNDTISLKEIRDLYDAQFEFKGK